MKTYSQKSLPWSKIGQSMFPSSTTEVRPCEWRSCSCSWWVLGIGAQNKAILKRQGEIYIQKWVMKGCLKGRIRRNNWEMRRPAYLNYTEKVWKLPQSTKSQILWKSVWFGARLDFCSSSSVRILGPSLSFC